MNVSFNLDDAFLKKLQGELLKMLLEVDRICRKHDIKYCLGGGTLLGAIRHKGFIPWDDDADVFFLREEYDKFRQVVESELPKEYFFQDTKTDPGSHYIYSKIRRNDSLYVTEFGNSQEMHKGIFLDLFVHDATPASLPLRKMHMLKTHYVRAMQVASWSGKRYKKPPIIAGLLNRKLESTSTEYWDEQVYKTVSKYRDSKNKKFSYDGVGEHLSHGVFPIDWIIDTVDVEFEGYKLMAPKNFKEYLEFSYGSDYMSPPPADKQHPDHGIVRIKFPGEEEMRSN